MFILSGMIETNLDSRLQLGIDHLDAKNHRRTKLKEKNFFIKQKLSER